MKRLTRAVICIAGLVATTAIAQQAGQPGQTQPGQQPGQQPGLSGQRQQSDTTYSATGRQGAHAQGQSLRASKVIGAEVKSSSGEEMGKIEDVVLNPQAGRIEFAVIDWQNKLVPVPVKLLNASMETGGITGREKVSFTAQIDKEKFQSAPTISDRGRWSELQQGNFSQRVYAHYGVQMQEGVGAPGSDTGTGQGREGTRPGTRTPGRSGTEPQTPGTSPRTPN